MDNRLSVKAVIFDLDDTLYCEHDYVRSGFKAVACYLSEKHSLLFDDMYTSLVDEWVKHGRGKVFDRVCEKRGLQENILELVQVYREHMPTIKLYQDAEVILRELREKEIPIGIITDGNSGTQWKKIKALQIEELVDAIIVTDDLGPNCWKPSETPYLEVARNLDIKLSESVYIGDNPHKDFITAKKLGVNTIRVIREVGDYMKSSLSPEYEADYVVTRLSQVPIILEKYNT